MALRLALLHVLLLLVRALRLLLLLARVSLH
jgi:hypothetical protein